MSSSLSGSSSDQYSSEQMLCALQALLPEITGDERQFGAETRIDEFMKGSGDWDELDLADVWYALDRALGFPVESYGEWSRTSLDEWSRLFGAKPYCTDEREWQQRFGQRLTFRAIAEFLATRVPAVHIKPILVLGKRCIIAGAFRAVQRIANEIDRRCRPFGPGTRIRERFRGEKLRSIWTRLRWLSANRLPPLRLTIWESFDRLFFSWFGLIATLITGGYLVAWCRSIGFSVTTSVGAPVSLLAWSFMIAYVFREQWENPLPAGYNTFADVARAMVPRQTGEERNTAE